MWSLWRVHDVLEVGTPIDAAGRPSAGSRALPDGEIFAGRARARDILPCCVSPYIDAASNAQAARDLRASNARKVQAA